MLRSLGLPTATVVVVCVAAALLPATALAGPAPSILSESASNVTKTDAILEARIDPGSGEDGFALETTYEFFLEAPSCFSYGFGACEASGGVQIAKGTLPAGSSPQVVSVDVAQAWHELTPGTLYGYRVVASNEAGTVYGVQPELTFTTLPAGTPCVEDPQDCPPPPGPCVEDPQDCPPPPGPCVEDPQDCVHPPPSDPVVTPGPVSNEPPVPLVGDHPVASGAPSTFGVPSTPNDGAGPAVVPLKATPGKPLTKHGKRRKHHGQRKHRRTKAAGRRRG